jgi:uncharacterized protein YlaI
MWVSVLVSVPVQCAVCSQRDERDESATRSKRVNPLESKR